jgi:GT2 family glycosyltransferase
MAGCAQKIVNEPLPAVDAPPGVQPLISVVVINYNGAAWLERCLRSVQEQTIFPQLEIILADNASPDQSDQLAGQIMHEWPRARVVRNGTNLGYSEGNNRGAEHARGQYLFFLNNDTWLEPDCLERLLHEVRAADAAVATPLVMDYVNNLVQTAGEGGFDAFGFLSHQTDWSVRREIFVASGCSLLIQADLFRKLGGFDSLFFMYADEFDLCWRARAAGEKVILAPSARMHHRGAAAVNPLGRDQVLEARTSDTKRYYANRNCMLVLLKNCQHLLLLMVPLQLALLAAEALAMGALSRRWSHVRHSYGQAMWDCWCLRGYVLAERRRLRALRRHGDFHMLRFLRLRLNRWDEMLRFRRLGLPKVDEE